MVFFVVCTVVDVGRTNFSEPTSILFCLGSETAFFVISDRRGKKIRNCSLYVDYWVAAYNLSGRRRFFSSERIAVAFWYPTVSEKKFGGIPLSPCYRGDAFSYDCIMHLFRISIIENNILSQKFKIKKKKFFPKKKIFLKKSSIEY